MQSLMRITTLLSFAAVAATLLGRVHGQDAFINEIVVQPDQAEGFVEIVGSASRVKTGQMNVWISLYSELSQPYVELELIGLTNGTDFNGKLMGGEKASLPSKGVFVLHGHQTGGDGNLFDRVCFGFGDETPPAGLNCTAADVTGGVEGGEMAVGHYRRIDTTNSSNPSRWLVGDFIWATDTKNDSATWQKMNTGQKFIAPSGASTLTNVLAVGFLAATVTSLLNV